MTNRNLTRACVAFLALAAAMLCTPQDAVGRDAPITLTMKFKPGSVTRYKVNMAMTMSMSGLQARSTPMHMDTVVTMAQKVDRPLPGGGGVVTVTYGKPAMTMNGKPMPAPGATSAMKPVTMQYDAHGNVRSANEAGAASGPGMAANMFGSGSGVVSPGLLPNHPVKPGDSWKGSFPIPMLGGNMTFKYTLVDVRTVAGYRVAHIQVAVRMSIHASGSGAPGATLPAGVSGVVSGAGAADFAIDQGKIVRTVMKVNVSPTMAAGQAGGAAGMKMHMDMTMKIVP